MSEKTEDPTPKKLRDARQKGQVAHSKEVVSALLICVIFAYFWSMSDFYIEEFKSLIIFPSTLYEADFKEALSLLLDTVIATLIATLLPIIALVFAAGIIANVIQVGFLISGESITPDIKKINPAEGIKKIFSKKSLFEVLKSIVKIAFLGSLIYMIIMDNLPTFDKIPHCGMDCVLPFMGYLFKQLIMYSAAAFIILAVIDFLFQKSQHIKQLKMSKDEVKREYKESEGDPEIKGKRKQLHKEMLSEEIKPRVKSSTAIVTNPTHVAVGIFYEKGVTPLPIITVVGTDAGAQNIKAIARDAGIPMMENVPLARGLLAAAEVDRYIPSEFIEPVAEVLKWVNQLKAENIH